MCDELIELLAYPRYHLRDELEVELGACVHDGRYDNHDPHCILCQNRAECRWLFDNDEFTALKLHSKDQLLQALEFALEYVDSVVARWGHDVRLCHCDACQWLRKTRPYFP